MHIKKHVSLKRNVQVLYMPTRIDTVAITFNKCLVEVVIEVVCCH